MWGKLDWSGNIVASIHFQMKKIINFSMFRLKRKEALANLSYYDAFVFLDLESSEIFQNGGQKRQNLTRLHVPYLYTPTTWSQHTFNTSIQLHSWRHLVWTSVLILMMQCLLAITTLNSNNLLYQIISHKDIVTSSTMQYR